MASSSSRIVSFYVLDGLACVLLFFLAGMYHEAKFLDTDTTHYRWDESLIDVLTVSTARSLAGIILWLVAARLARRSVEQLLRPDDCDRDENTPATGLVTGDSLQLPPHPDEGWQYDPVLSTPPFWIRLSAVGLPVASMVFSIAKMVYLEVDHRSADHRPPPDGSAWGLVQATVACSLAFSLIESALGFNLGKYYRSHRATVIAERCGHASVNGKTDGDVGTDNSDGSYDSDDSDDSASGSENETNGTDEHGTTDRSSQADSNSMQTHTAQHKRRRKRKQRKGKRGKGKKDANLGRLTQLVFPEWPLLLGGMLALLVSSGANIVTPLFFGRVIDAAVAPKHQHDKLNREIIILACIFFGGAVFTILRSWAFTLAGQRLVARVRKMVFAAIVRQDIGFFDKNRTGELTNRLASDTSVIQNALTVNVSMLFRYIVQIFGSLGIMFSLSWKLTLVLLSVVPPVAIGAVWYGSRVKKLRKKFQDELALASATAEEVISSMRTVRSFSNEPHASETYDVAIDRSYQVGKLLAVVVAGFAGITSMFASAAVTLMLWYGGTLVISGTLSSGLLSGFMLYTLQVAMAFAFLSSLYGDFMQAVGASVRLFKLIDRIPAIACVGGARPSGFEPKIVFEDVVFRYPTRKDALVLDKVSFTVEPGSVVALVGPSGGGKSTVVSMIERFYAPESGVVTVSGHNLAELEPAWVHEHVALVGQEPVLFAMTIHENIAYGKPDATQEAIEAAAKMANAHDFISAFDKGYDTKVGERGVRLSGGQKQRIAIARALLMDPEILLLDEATSALDAESEHVVQEAIDNAMQGRTVLVIAHRLSTVRHADNILVVDKGQIVEQGTHDDLLAKSGIYYKLVQRQLQAGQTHDSDDENNDDVDEKAASDNAADDDKGAAV